MAAGMSGAFWLNDRSLERYVGYISLDYSIARVLSIRMY